MSGSTPAIVSDSVDDVAINVEDINLQEEGFTDTLESFEDAIDDDEAALQRALMMSMGGLPSNEEPQEDQPSRKDVEKVHNAKAGEDKRRSRAT